MSKLITGFNSLKDKIKAVETAAVNATTKVNRLSNALQGVTGGSAGLNVSTASNGTTTTGNAVSQAIASSQASVIPKAGSSPVAQAGMIGGSGSGFFSNMRGAIFPNGSGGGAGWAQAAQYASQAIGSGINTIDNRTNQMYGRVLQNDQLSVLYQQTKGISQQGVYDQYRQPLQQFRLGANGINTLLGLQAQTGISAQKQAGSVQGLSAALGYSYSTQDFASMLTTLANPMVNNRMTMTLGTGLYGPGGKQRSMTEVFQGIVRGSGLTNERYLAGAMQQGSSARARLTQLGVPEDMQNAILQYAQGNLQFQKKTGGKMGMYNPELKAQRKIMGIEENVSTQQQETTRLQEVKDEKYYNRQKDNYASMEKNTQKMIELTTRIEELTSAITGARISTRGNPITRAIGKAGKTALQILPYVLAAGDGTETASNKKGASATSNRVVSASSSGLNDKFRERLDQMINASGGKVGIGGGFRSSAEQRRMFLSRYTRSSDKTGTFWDGSYWKKNGGVADAAPPGMSMHEIGLAADLTGDLSWVQQNAAKYGLKTFANVNNEPWHVQPAELPNSRRMYEKGGAAWGTIAGAEPMDPNSTFEGMTSDGGVSDALFKSTGSGTVNQFSQMNMGAQIDAFRASTGIGSSDGGGGGYGRKPMVRGKINVGKGLTALTGGKQVVMGVPTADQIPPGFKFRTTSSYGGWGYYVPKLFSDASLEALHRAERPDWNATVKNSDGVLMGGFAMNQYNWNRAGGKRFAETPALASPEQQKQVVKVLLDEMGAHNGFESIVRGSVSWPDVGKLKSIDMPANVSTSTIQGSGDPTMPSRGGGSTTIVQGGGITIAPNIYIQSTGSNTADAKRAAQEVANLISQDLKRTAMRNL
jgi:LAS superfamily LD-carboxypeptidase LdcB